MLHIPALRLGKPYTSLEKATLVHHVTGDPVAEVSQVTGSMIARDMPRMADAKRELAKIPIRDLIAIYAKAADYFANGTLPIGDQEQTFDDYIRSLSSRPVRRWCSAVAMRARWNTSCETSIPFSAD